MTESKNGKAGKCCVIINNDKLEPPIAWLTLAAAFMTVMIGVGHPDISIGIFYDYFVERFDVNRAGWVVSIYHAAIGWVVSIYHVTGCLCAIGWVVSIYHVTGCQAAIGWVVSIYHVTGCLCGKLPLAGWSPYIM